MSATEHWVKFEDDGFIGLVGPIFQSPAEPGKGRFRFIADEKHRNKNGVVHGGMLLAFADRALGATARQRDARRKHATAQLNVQFMRSAKIGAVVELEARVLRETRNLVFVEGTLFSGGEVVAAASGIWSIIAQE